MNSKKEFVLSNFVGRAKIFLLDIPVALKGSPSLYLSLLFIYRWRQNLRLKKKQLNNQKEISVFTFKIFKPSNLLCHRFPNSNSTHQKVYPISIENHHSREKSTPRELLELSLDVSDAIGIQYFSVIK